jgi:trypsin
MRRLLGLAVAVTLLSVLPARAQAVVGGANVPEGSAPYAVALLGGSDRLEDWQRVFCGGSLVGPRTVLTAAHCALEPGPVEVLVGRTNLLDVGGRRVEVVDAAVHPSFDGWTFRNDVALLTLAEPVAAAPIALASPAEALAAAPGTPAVVLGWGSLSSGQRTQTAWLQAGTVPILTDDACAAVADPATQLCAGPPAGAADACQGDSGGPLVATVGDRTVQVGIVSSGRGCGRAPGVYTRLAAPAVAGWLDARLGGDLVTASADPSVLVRLGPAVRTVRRLHGGRIAVRGTCSSRPVTVQRRSGRRWVTVARAARCSHGRFRVVFRAASVPRVRVREATRP